MWEPAGSVAARLNPPPPTIASPRGLNVGDGRWGLGSYSLSVSAAEASRPGKGMAANFHLLLSFSLLQQKNWEKDGKEDGAASYPLRPRGPKNLESDGERPRSPSPPFPPFANLGKLKKMGIEKESKSWD